MKIDIFNHVLPPPLLERFATFMPGPPVKRWQSIKTLYDVDVDVSRHAMTGHLTIVALQAAGDRRA